MNNKNSSFWPLNYWKILKYLSHIKKTITIFSYSSSSSSSNSTSHPLPHWSDHFPNQRREIASRSYQKNSKRWVCWLMCMYDVCTQVEVNKDGVLSGGELRKAFESMRLIEAHCEIFPVFKYRLKYTFSPLCLHKVSRAKAQKRYITID